MLQRHKSDHNHHEDNHVDATKVADPVASGERPLVLEQARSLVLGLVSSTMMSGQHRQQVELRTCPLLAMLRKRHFFA